MNYKSVKIATNSGEPPPLVNVLANPYLGGDYVQRGPPEVRVAPGWQDDYLLAVPSPEGPQDPDHWCSRPEYRSVSRFDFPQRVVWGERAQCAFVRWKIMDACIYQVAPVPVGVPVTLEADVQAWCSAFDDPSKSEGELYFRLGLDLERGTFPLSEGSSRSIVWGGWTRGTAEYQTLRLMAWTTNPHVTAIVEFWNKYRLAHNDAYVDRCVLLVNRWEPPTPPVEPDYVTRAELAELLRDMAEALDLRSVDPEGKCR